MKNVQQVDEKFYMKSKVVMLPTRDKTKLYLSNFSAVLNVASSPSYYETGQHFYLICESDIKAGDWVIEDLGDECIGKCKVAEIEEDNVYFEGSGVSSPLRVCKKIIATTDFSMTVKREKFGILWEELLPSPKESFISDYTDWYDKGVSTIEVLIEVESNGEIQVNPDRTVSILSVEHFDKAINFADEIDQITDYDKGRWYGRIEGYNQAKNQK